MNLLQLQKEIPENLEFEESLETLNEIINMINKKEKKLFLIINNILRLFTENKIHINTVLIQKLFNSLNKITGGFNPTFFSFYDLIKFQILNYNTNVNKNTDETFFKKYELGIAHEFSYKFKEIIDDISIEYKQNSNETINYNDFFIQKLVKYISYSGYNFYRDFLITTLINLNKTVKNSELKKKLNTFYLKISNEFWNDILNKIYLKEIKLKYLLEWNNNSKNEYRNHVIKQITILQCIILYKAVDFMVLRKNEAYYKVIEILNNNYSAFQIGNDDKSYKQSFFKEILFKSGWKVYYYQNIPQ